MQCDMGAVNPYIISEPGNWHLDEAAPDAVKCDFMCFMAEVEQEYNKYLFTGKIEVPFYPNEALKIMKDKTLRQQHWLLSLIDKSDLDDVLMLYSDRFSDVYPVMLSNKSEAEIVRGVKQCLINNKPVDKAIPPEWDV